MTDNYQNYNDEQLREKLKIREGQKSKEEWTEQDRKENMHYQEHRKPLRFQFGHDATEEDVDKFLDMILGPEPEDSKEENEEPDSES